MFPESQTKKGTILRGSFYLSAGRILERALQFLRNIIVARLISPEDFGIAALLAMAISFLEMITNLAFDTLLIQSPRGDEPSFQANSQLVTAVRGLAIALILFLLGGPMARLFNVPETAWAFRMLSLVPLIRGLTHQDMVRYQRNLEYLPILKADVTSQLVSFLLAWPLAAWLGNYSAILFLILIQSFARAVMSHLVSERPYRWAWEQKYIRELLSFGWPLLINGILLFFIMQGDRFVIGAADSLFSRETYTKAQLGYYSAAFILSGAIYDALTSMVSPLMLPLLARVQEQEDTFHYRCRLCIEAMALIACQLGIFFILLGGWLLVWLYGSAYQAGAPLMAWLGLSSSIRFFRMASATIALSKKDSPNLTLSNCFRVMSFALAFLFAAHGADLIWIAMSSLIGEVLAFGVSIFLLQYRLDIPVAYFVRGVGACLIAFPLAFFFENWVFTRAINFSFFIGSFALIICLTGCLIFLFPQLAREIKNILPARLVSRFSREN